jgi:hypothetical protein
MIAAAFGVSMDALREEADMLANTNAQGQPVACMRFMGGREFAELAGPHGRGEACTLADLERMMNRGTLALPSFAAAGGPFAGRAGRVTGPEPQNARERYALATLYLALLTDYCLDALGAAGPLSVEGSFTANEWFGVLLAGLRPRQKVSYSDDGSGTTCGAWLLRYPDSIPPASGKTVPPIDCESLLAYRQHWRDAVLNDPSGTNSIDLK